MIKNIEEETVRPAASLIDDLIESWSTPDETVTVTVAIAGGEAEIEFRVIRDRAELSAAKRGAKRFAEAMSPEQWPIEAEKEFFDTDLETKLQAWLLADAAVDKAFTPVQFLKLAKRAGPVFEWVVRTYDKTVLGTIANQVVEGIMAKKNELNEISSGEASSPLAETTMDDTQTP